MTRRQKNGLFTLWAIWPYLCVVCIVLVGARWPHLNLDVPGAVGWPVVWIAVWSATLPITMWVYRRYRSEKMVARVVLTVGANVMLFPLYLFSLWCAALALLLVTNQVFI